jgi:DNA-binding transcriptional regulator YdaS (Cro superfamily)
MQFKTYFFALTKKDRAAFAEKAGTTVGHLNNFSYGYTKLAPEVCVSIEKATGGVVKRWDLRPEDWSRIWPELIGMEGAPEVPQATADIAQPAINIVANGVSNA